MKSIEEEIWKVCNVTSRNVFEVSSEGRIKKNGQIIEPHNYRNTEYYGDPSGCEHLLHRLVAKTFIPNPENKPCIDHINCNKHDNRIENLRWVTYSENMLNPITNKNMRESLKITFSDKTRHPMYGKHHSPEHTKHQSEAQKGRIPWNKNKQGVQTAWNKGITKEDNKSLTIIGNKVSETKKKQYSSGQKIIHNKNRKYMNNGVSGLWVDKSDFDKYIKLGYKFGYINK